MKRHTEKTFKKEVSYNNSTLKKISQKMRRYDHNSVRSALNSYKPNFSIVNSMIAVDSREAIAIEFLSTMAEDITFSGKKRWKTVKSWIKKIVEEIRGKESAGYQKNIYKGKLAICTTCQMKIMRL